MKKFFMVMLIILITIQQGEVVSKNQCLIYLVSAQNSRAYFHITLPSMQVLKFVMAGGERRIFETDNKEYFFDLLKITENKVSFEITEKK